MAILAACSSGDYTSGPVTTRTSTTIAETTLRGVVGDYSSSARVIILAQPASGVRAVVVSLDTEIVRVSGAKADVADLASQTRFEVTGHLSNPGTLVARRIVLL